MKKEMILAVAVLSNLAACQTIEKASVVAATGTTIGLEIGQSPANATPGLKFGYNRAEVAVVSEKVLNGANSEEDVANVVMELRYSSRESNAPGVYQRLAVGKVAVSQAGATLMFAKGPDGAISSDAAAAVDAAVESTFGEDQFNGGGGRDEEPAEILEVAPDDDS